MFVRLLLDLMVFKLRLQGYLEDDRITQLKAKYVQKCDRVF